MEVVSFLRSQHASHPAGCFCEIVQEQGYSKTEYSRCEHHHQGVLRHHLLLSHLFPTSCSSRRCLGAKSASALLHTRSSDVPELGKDNWEMLPSCSLGRLPSTAEGPAHPQPQDKMELISSPQQPPPACTSYPQLPGQGDMEVRSTVPLQALFPSAEPCTPWGCPHVLLQESSTL